MKRLIERRRPKASLLGDYKVGCILLEQPFFFSEQDWIPIPPDFIFNIAQGKTYDLEQSHDLRLWEDVILKLHAIDHSFGEIE